MKVSRKAKIVNDRVRLKEYVSHFETDCKVVNLKTVGTTIRHEKKSLDFAILNKKLGFKYCLTVCNGGFVGLHYFRKKSEAEFIAKELGLFYRSDVNGKRFKNGKK